MLTFLLRRVLQILPALIGVTLLSFALIHLIPGDPVEVMAGQHNLRPAEHAQMMHMLGLDGPLWLQYVRYVGAAVRGDLGASLFTHQPVMTEFLERFPATLELGTVAIVFALLVGLPAGIVAALRRGRWPDHAVMAMSLTGYSMPVFWWGLLLILLFSVQLGWTPVSGRIGAAFSVDPRTGLLLVDTLWAGDHAAFRDALRHLILPAVALGTIPLAVIARMTRSAMLEVLGEDYIRTARAKGVPAWRVVLIHALRNALIPVVTVTGLQIGTLLAGALLTETIFSWPGVAQWLVMAIYQRDYPVVQGGILLVAMLIIGLNLLVDLTYGIINPRIRHAR